MVDNDEMMIIPGVRCFINRTGDILCVNDWWRKKGLGVNQEEAIWDEEKEN